MLVGLGGIMATIEFGRLACFAGMIAAAGGAGAGCGDGTGVLPPQDTELQAVEVASGLEDPVHLTSPANDDRLFVVEQPGRIRIIEDGTLLATPSSTSRRTWFRATSVACSASPSIPSTRATVCSM